MRKSTVPYNRNRYSVAQFSQTHSYDGTVVQQIIQENRNSLKYKPQSLRRSMSDGNFVPMMHSASQKVTETTQFTYEQEQPKAYVIPSPGQSSCCSFNTQVCSSNANPSVVDSGWYRSFPPPVDPPQPVFPEAPSPHACSCFNSPHLPPSVQNSYVSCQEHLTPYEYQNSSWNPRQEQICLLYTSDAADE